MVLGLGSFGGVGGVDGFDAGQSVSMLCDGFGAWWIRPRGIYCTGGYTKNATVPRVGWSICGLQCCALGHRLTCSI